MIKSIIPYMPGIFLFVLIQGCTMVQTYPLAARAGDTITIAPGSLDGATKTNLTVEYYSNSAPTTPINLSPYIRSVFNIMPDRTSPAWLTSGAIGMPVSSNHGPWQTVVAIDLPSAGLPVGPGNLRITLGNGVISPPITYNPNNVNISLEILPGVGISNPFSYMGQWWDSVIKNGTLNDLMPGKQYVIKTDPGDPGFAISYAAAEYTLYMPFRNKIGGLPPIDDDVYMYVTTILDAQPNNEFYQLSMRWYRNGDNIVIYVTSPLNGGDSRRTRLSIVMDKVAPFDFFSTPYISKITYYDQSGNEITPTNIPKLQGINL